MSAKKSAVVSVCLPKSGSRGLPRAGGTSGVGDLRDADLAGHSCGNATFIIRHGELVRDNPGSRVHGRMKVDKRKRRKLRF